MKNLQLPTATEVAWDWSIGTAQHKRFVQAIPKRDENDNLILEERRSQLRPVIDGHFAISRSRKNKYEVIIEYFGQNGNPCLNYCMCKCDNCKMVYVVRAEISALKGVFNWSNYVQRGYWTSLERINEFMNSLQILINKLQEQINEV
tara:strand:+ start:741 stop:1181 length:441 start_codon:yes stop_codon:yes gene_type:complete